MNKIYLYLLMAVLLLNLAMPTRVEACGGIFSEEKDNPVTFDCLYPTPVYETSVFKWSAIIVVSIGVAVATVYTGGAASVPGATLIGGMLGTTWTAGLATLGGGTLAAGGFGMAGGAFVIAATTDLTIAGLTSFIPLPENNMEGKDYSYIKISLPEKGSEITLSYYKKIDEVFDKYQDGEMSNADYEKKMYQYYTDALNNINTEETKYDLINGAIITYNLGKYEESRNYLDNAMNYFPKSSYIYYHQSLLNLVDGSLSKALDNLSRTIVLEPDVLQPYLIKTQIAIDTKQYGMAINTITQGLDKYDDDNFQLNYLGGMIAFNDKDYKQAIVYFEDALSNTTINEIEADTKLWIAKCYQRSNNHEEASDWYDDAMSEVDDNKEYQKVLEKQYEE